MCDQASGQDPAPANPFGHVEPCGEPRALPFRTRQPRSLPIAAGQSERRPWHIPAAGDGWRSGCRHSANVSQQRSREGLSPSLAAGLWGCSLSRVPFRKRILGGASLSWVSDATDVGCGQCGPRCAQQLCALCFTILISLAGSGATLGLY